MSKWDWSRRNTTYASWSFGIGAASLASGVIVYALAPARQSTAVSLAPLLAPGSAGLSAAGRF
jgi:hypothetical protein